MIIFEWINSVIWFVGFSSLLTFIVPFALQAFLWNKPQDLKAKYNAKWALVTGGSSGIGRALTEKLASQGINVVIVALDDDLLKTFYKEISAKYPNLQFRSVGCDLGTEGYMNQITKATEDITINLVFNNAGYVLIGLFSDVPIERVMKNVECNALAAVRITHHFVNKMLAAKVKGCVTFTASSSCYLPAPTTSMYVSTKMFITNFATSIGPELGQEGIDVCVLQPSPVDTNFYKAENISKHDTLRFFGGIAQPPSVIADTFFATIGRGTTNRDQGAITVAVKILMKVLDYNLLAWIFKFVIPFQKEFKALRADRDAKKKTN